MLHRTSRPEVGIVRIVSPWNSSARKFAPCALIFPIRWRIRSFGPTYSGKAPVTTTLIVGGTSTLSAAPSVQTLAISVAPIPNAKAPSAPWLVVCESVPTTTVPGRT